MCRAYYMSFHAAVAKAQMQATRLLWPQILPLPFPSQVILGYNLTLHFHQMGKTILTLAALRRIN